MMNAMREQRQILVLLARSRMEGTTMKIICMNKEHIGRRLRFLGRIVLLALGLLLLIFVCIHMQFLSSMTRFLYMMGKIPAWTTVDSDTVETYPLDDMEQIACLLLKQSERDRRCMIAVYNAYARIRADHISHSSKLYLLLRLLFDVPEEYPADAARFFGGWVGLEDPRRTLPESETVNLLWPLGYQDQQLVLKGTFWLYFGLPYNGLGEYDYFVSRFLLRSVDDLE